MPPLKDPLKAKKVLMPYIKNESVFKNPGGWTYLPNPNLSGYRLAKVSSPANMPLYFEAAPAKDFTRAVAFCDGHVKRIGEAEWQKLKRAYKIRIGV
jgi:hypothetical protein